ncbi:MAG: polymer-forming cytoskeletal protein [Bacillota bacterium]|nr:polymer-forming cytoskeletal protein [Bacillota bacterium]
MLKKDSFDLSSDKVNTVIGKGTSFQGTMVGNGLIRIDGEAKGDITNKGDVIIGESGTVAVDLKARNVTIAGHFEGSIEAEGRLELKKTSTAVGKFKVNGLLIEEGAIISGGMEMTLKDKDNKVLHNQDDQRENNSETR